MPRKNKYLYDENSDGDDLFVSRSQKKRDSSALQEVGEALAKLPPKKLALLPLTEDLIAAYDEYRRISNKEAKRRHLQYVGRLMREAQIEAANTGGVDLVERYYELKNDGEI